MAPEEKGGAWLHRFPLSHESSRKHKRKERRRSHPGPATPSGSGFCDSDRDSLPKQLTGCRDSPGAGAAVVTQGLVGAHDRGHGVNSRSWGGISNKNFRAVSARQETEEKRGKAWFYKNLNEL